MLTPEEQETTKFAEEGTLAHEIAEFFLNAWLKGFREGKSDEEMRSSICVGALPEHIRNNKRFDVKNIITPLIEYNNHVVADFRQFDTDFSLPTLYIEKKFNSKEDSEYWGTPDAVIVTTDSINIYDLKFGMGVPVSAEDNKQLLSYAICVCDTLDIRPTKINLNIIQPRLNNISVWGCDIDYLDTFREEIRKGIKAAKEETPVQMNGDHCKFCHSLGSCKAIADKFVKAKEKPAYLLTKEELTNYLNDIDSFKKWINTLEDTIYKLAMRGEKIKGYKLVESVTKRTIQDTEKVAERLINAGYEPYEIYNTTLISLGDIEKLIGKKNDLIKDLIYKPAGGATLVKESDRRKEIIINSVIDDLCT